MAITSADKLKGMNLGGSMALVQTTIQRFKEEVVDGKQDALAFNTAYDAATNKVATMADVGTLPENVACFSNDTGDGVIPSDGIKAESVSAGATISVNPDVVTVISGNVGTAAITLQVPSDNLAHVWDILMTTGSSVNVTYATSTSATIKKPESFAVGASKACEISVIGVGSTFYLRYGEFA